jgi:hypothetical protein
MISKEFLESKVTSTSIYYGGLGSGNIEKIAENIFKFHAYNFLPGTNPHGLDGHYCFIINIENFTYRIYKDSDYGSLSYVLYVKNKVFTEVHKSIKEKVEDIIACKLLGAFFYDGDACCHRGKNLFSDNTPPELFRGCLNYKDGYKYSVICTWVDDYPNEPLGKLSKIDKLAIKELKSK